MFSYNIDYGYPDEFDGQPPDLNASMSHLVKEEENEAIIYDRDEGSYIKTTPEYMYSLEDFL